MSAEYTKVGTVSDFPAGSFRKVDVSGVSILVVNVDGKLYAMSNSCTHRGAPLNDGELDHDVVICPWHGGQFNIVTGQVISPPPMKGLSVFDVQVRGADVLLRRK
jgi:nitrite reductase/ring-hydroxylating ferredoxin subunit